MAAINTCPKLPENDCFGQNRKAPNSCPKLPENPYRVSGSISDTLSDLAYRVERLTPHPRQPERFHEDKGEIVADLHHLAQEARRCG